MVGEDIHGMLYQENVNDEFIGKAFHRSHKGWIAELWLFRSLGIFSVVFGCIFLIYGLSQAAALIISFLCFLVSFVTLMNSEVGQLLMRRASYPITVYDDGIQIHASREQGRKGFTGFIPANKIDWIHIRENEVVYPEWFQKFPVMDMHFVDVIKAKNSATELIIHTEDGHLYRSGVKPKETTMAISNEMSTRWQIKTI